MECPSCGKSFLITNPNFCPYCAAKILNRHPIKPSIKLIQNDGILKYVYYDVKIFAGENAARMCTVNEFLFLKQEKDNEYDSNAIAVKNKNHKKIGYLYKGKLQDMANDYLNHDMDVEAYVFFNDIEKNEILISLAFYKPISDDDIIKTFKISMSASKYDKLFPGDVYMDIPVGEEIEVEFDDEKDKYIVENWASLPKNLYEYAENDNYSFAVLEDEFQDNESHMITIGIFNKEILL